MKRTLMLYFPLLDPVMSNPEAVLETYYQYGCRIIEISLPCRNPCLDGQTVRDSMERILRKSTIGEMFEAIRCIKERCPDIKVQIMSYSEIIEQIGYKKFADLCKKARVDYVLSPDASDHQLTILDNTFAEIYDIPVIRFIPYTNHEEMLRKAKDGKGYLFLQSGNAKTGEDQKIGADLKSRIDYLRNINIDLPIIVGFGIKSYEQIKACYECGADGITIGSSVINYIAKSEIENYLVSLTETM